MLLLLRGGAFGFSEQFAPLPVFHTPTSLKPAKNGVRGIKSGAQETLFKLWFF